LWQRGFYDHVVRDEQDLRRIREYIATNPIRWASRSVGGEM
jgi:REP element-mobilizing transposase RayT